MRNTISSISKQTRSHSEIPWKPLLLSACCIIFLFLLNSNNTLAAGSNGPTLAPPSSMPMPMQVNTLQIQLQTRPAGPVTSIYNSPIIANLYHKLYQLPAYPQGRTCEEFRQGDVYSLTFAFNKHIITHASVEKNGCHGLTLSPWDTRQPDQAFWNLFDQALNSGHGHVVSMTRTHQRAIGSLGSRRSASWWRWRAL